MPKLSTLTHHKDHAPSFAAHPLTHNAILGEQLEGMHKFKLNFSLAAEPFRNQAQKSKKAWSCFFQAGLKLLAFAVN